MGNNLTTILAASMVTVISSILISVGGFCFWKKCTENNTQLTKTEKDRRLNGFVNQTEIFGDKGPFFDEFIEEATCSVYEQGWRDIDSMDGLYKYNVYKFNNEYLVSPNINNPDEIYFLRKDGNPVTRKEDLEYALRYCLCCSSSKFQSDNLRQSGHIFTQDEKRFFVVNGKEYACRYWCEFCWDGNDWDPGLFRAPWKPDLKTYLVNFCILDKNSHDVVLECPATYDCQAFHEWPKKIEEWVCAEGADKIQERLDRIGAVEKS